jgi:hypothetical protein
MDLGALVQSLGLPTAIAVFFIWRDYQTNKEHKQDLKDIALKAVQAIDANTEALKDSTVQTKLNTNALGENSNIMSEVKGVLSTRGVKQNGLANGN